MRIPSGKSHCWLLLAAIAIVATTGLRCAVAADDATTKVTSPASDEAAPTDSAVPGSAPAWQSGAIDSDAAAESDQQAWPDGTQPDPNVIDLYDRIAASQAASVIPHLLVSGASMLFIAGAFLAIALGSARAEKNAGAWWMHLAAPFVVGLALWAYGFALGWGNWFNGPVAPGWYPAFGHSLSELHAGIGLGAILDGAGNATGGYKFGLIGTKGFFLAGADQSVKLLFLFMLPFAMTAAIIPIGTLGEHWRFRNFVLYSLWFALPYALYANWMWGGGWLAQAGINWGLGHGAVDFSGAGVVYGLAGVVALAGCMAIGRRGGNVDTKLAPPSAPRLAWLVIGTAMLVLPAFWIQPEPEAGSIGAKPMLSIVAAGVAAALLRLVRGQPVDTATICRGLLSGLAAIAAACPFVGNISASVIGGVSGLLCLASLDFLERRGVDDATGAISIFGAGGIWGLIAPGLFADGRWGEGWNGVIRPEFVESYGTDGVRGLFFGDPWQLAAQLLGAGVLVLFGLTMGLAGFKLSNLLAPMRIGRAAESGRLASTSP